VFSYTDLQSEDELNKVTDKFIYINKNTNEKIDWPNKGLIEFKNASMKYRETLEPSIRNLNFTIQPKMKVGIVGRTGAGKSSILQALFRLCELCEGEILIDG